ncbi:gamma-secretase subunit pen-2 [Bactrocera neohumeralis]|uniref:gamma-secretase subunit pen-2 n=1 Tax=Bactrocera tryoni TaxID=59916 RepID=UPI001A95EA94|nr:gamma-secretase subunit pen-2 [Bactrocera tryoni]XP_039968882.1 gamma-secretase subunit pen-2-like [Bactrocera tryoni]XP_050327094.1 gamma-secretase subunit pen-2 [Bactrocera neohumeralis]
MDISKVTNEKKLQLCRIYFFAGLAFLPFLWTINVFWFFNDAFRAPAFPEQKRIKKFVISSLIGALIWSVILITWIIIFQTKRAEWGEMADRMSFIIPLGIA